MRSVTTELVHLLFAVPFYVLFALLILVVQAFVRGRNSMLHRWRYLLLAAIALTYLLSAPVFSNILVNALEDRYAIPSLEALENKKGQIYIVTLTAGWFRATPDGYEIKLGAADWERTELSVKLWKRTGGTVVFSGAPLPDKSDSVAQAMARLAIQLGLPQERARAETSSRNTYENLLFTQRLFRFTGDDTIILLTSAVQLPRAVAVARALGMEVIPYPCDYRGEKRVNWRLWLPGNDAAEALEEVLHEAVGIMAYWWRGWI